MNRSTRSFLRAVEHELRELGSVSIGLARKSCSACEDLDPDTGDSGEAGFTVSDCDSCGSSLSGNHFVAHAFGTGEFRDHVFHLSICMDCLTYHANGDLPKVWYARAGEEEGDPS